MWIKVKPEDFEKEVCSRCPADINKDYSPCKKCKKCKKQNDFETVYKVWEKTVKRSKRI